MRGRGRKKIRRLRKEEIQISRQGCDDSTRCYISNDVVPAKYQVCVSTRKDLPTLFDVRNLHTWVTTQNTLPSGDIPPSDFRTKLERMFRGLDLKKPKYKIPMPIGKAYVCEDGDDRPGCRGDCDGQEDPIMLEEIQGRGLRLVSGNVGRCFESETLSDAFARNPQDPYTRMPVDQRSLDFVKEIASGNLALPKYLPEEMEQKAPAAASSAAAVAAVPPLVVAPVAPAVPPPANRASCRSGWVSLGNNEYIALYPYVPQPSQMGIPDGAQIYASRLTEQVLNRRGFRNTRGLAYGRPNVSGTKQFTLVASNYGVGSSYAIIVDLVANTTEAHMYMSDFNRDIFLSLANTMRRVQPENIFMDMSRIGKLRPAASLLDRVRPMAPFNLVDATLSWQDYYTHLDVMPGRDIQRSPFYTGQGVQQSRAGNTVSRLPAQGMTNIVIGHEFFEQNRRDVNEIVQENVNGYLTIFVYAARGTHKQEFDAFIQVSRSSGLNDPIPC